MFARPSAPLTPRSPAVGTPRSARRLTTTTTATTPSRPSTFAAAFPLAPLAPLALRPYPASAYAADDDFAALRADDRDNIDRAVDRMRQAGSDRLRELAGTMAEIDEGKRSVEEECRSLRDAAMDMTHQLKIERDQAEEAKDKEAEVAQRARKLKGDVDAIRADILEIEAKLAARRTLKLKQREAYQRQTSQNGPELVFFEEKLGLKIRGRARDVVQFKFTNIDPGNYNRPFSFDVDVSQPAYAISAIVPASFLPHTHVLTPLVNALNKSRDLYAFLRQMRAAFKLEVKLEKMAFAPGAEGEREKDAERTRLVREAAEAAAR